MPVPSRLGRTVGDECRIEIIDGEAIRIHGSKAMDEGDREAFAQIVRAAKAHMEAHPPAKLSHDPCCSSHGIAMTCARYRRTHFVEVRPCCEQDAIALGLAAATPTEEH